jgi:hypothetical protein
MFALSAGISAFTTFDDVAARRIGRARFLRGRCSLAIAQPPEGALDGPLQLVGGAVDGLVQGCRLVRDRGGPAILEAGFHHAALVVLAAPAAVPVTEVGATGGRGRDPRWEGGRPVPGRSGRRGSAASGPLPKRAPRLAWRRLLQPSTGAEDDHGDDRPPDRRPPAQRCRSAAARPRLRRRWRFATGLLARGLIGDGCDHSAPGRHRGRPPLARHGRRDRGLRWLGGLLLLRPAPEPPHEQIEQRHQHECQQKEDLLEPDRPHGSDRVIASGSAEAPPLPRRSLPAWWCRPARSSSGSSP